MSAPDERAPRDTGAAASLRTATASGTTSAAATIKRAFLKELKQIQANKKPMCNHNGSMMLDVRHEKQRTPFWCWAETSRCSKSGFHWSKSKLPTRGSGRLCEVKRASST